MKGGFQAESWSGGLLAPRGLSHYDGRHGNLSGSHSKIDKIENTKTFSATKRLLLLASGARAGLWSNWWARDGCGLLLV